MILGIDDCKLLCSKIRDDDQNNLYMVVKFRNGDESGISVKKRVKIPRDNIYRQVALKIGKAYNFDIPNYQALMKNLEEDTHAHVINPIITFLAKLPNI